METASADLTAIAQASDLAGFLPCPTENGEQDRRQNGDYRYHDKQLNEGEATIPLKGMSLAAVHRHSHPSCQKVCDFQGCFDRPSAVASNILTSDD
jgi:hypothetical protein